MSKNIKMEIWKKAVINCAINPVGAITGMKNGELIKNEYTAKIMALVVSECIEVAEKEGIAFDEDIFKKTEKIAELTSENENSMLQDIKKRKKTEIEFLNGKVTKIAESHGLKSPYNRTLYFLIKSMEKRYRKDLY
ncbi:hypothetical protein DRJ04_07725 [Candidatus Aerophobetes bacterium]|uniref:Ketopantoate reductase C-terminal domain-containing protein n=1 Tax=Aerophobetes bacterium TaxID=2030807 RepID=A0A662DBW6_UNCAE|nr:MAG: hypothetical protein DRJ04_07725 [Candidatus Aerophobetes bacterium]